VKAERFDLRADHRDANGSGTIRQHESRVSGIASSIYWRST